MANNRSDQTGPRFGRESDHQYRITVSQPEEIVRHDISDEELTALSDVRGDYLWDGKWVAVGVCIGAAPRAIQAFVHAYVEESDGTRQVSED